MKIVVDKNIPYLKGVVEQYGDVTYLAGNEFTKDSIKDADTLIVRTVTYFGKDILEGSNVKLICSATIGYDHIDTKYCDEHGIVWKNAPGCNSGSVMQYLVSVLVIISQQKGFQLRDKTIGIVGVGNVGKKVAKACEILGMKVLLNDPPRQRTENLKDFVDLETIKKKADIITFHTPLTKEGEDKTYHIVNEDFFNSLSKNPIIINSARGAIIDTLAIKKALSEKKISGAVIDCWENEPNIDLEYMRSVDIATPHIAGYSADGKANATRMSLGNLASFWKMSDEPIKTIKPAQIADSVINVDVESLESIILMTYNPMGDFQQLISAPSKFSELRGNYPVRREFQAYTIQGVEDNNLRETLRELGFKMG